MSGAIQPLPNTPSWPGAHLEKAQGQLYLYIYLCAYIISMLFSLLDSESIDRFIT
jgi:hypothetical protein